MSIIIEALPKGIPAARSKRKTNNNKQDNASEAMQRIFDMELFMVILSIKTAIVSRLHQF